MLKTLKHRLEFEMKTEKRNERTRRIFNGIMNAVMSAYGIKDNMDLKSIYDRLSIERDKTFYFLDTNGKIIDNILPYREDGVEDFRDDTVKHGRRLSFLYSDEYISVDLYDYRIRLIKSINIDDCKFNRYSTGDRKIRYVNSYDGICSGSTVLKKLFDDYIMDNYNKNNNKCLVMFETIFGSRCLERKEFDRIRYIYFTKSFISCESDCLYNIDSGSFCFGGFVTRLIKSTYQDPSIETYKSVFDNCFYIMKDALKSKREHTLKEIYKNLESVYKSAVKDIMVRNLSCEYNFMPLYNPLTDEELKQKFETKLKKHLDGIRGFNL